MIFQDHSAAFFQHLSPGQTIPESFLNFTPCFFDNRPYDAGEEPVSRLLEVQFVLEVEIEPGITCLVEEDGIDIDEGQIPGGEAEASDQFIGLIDHVPSLLLLGRTIYQDIKDLAVQPCCEKNQTPKRQDGQGLFRQ